jgi:hypothetical protein
MWKDILKECSCEEDSNKVELEKVAGAVTTAAPAHAKLFKPANRRRKKRCKKCRRK